MFRKFISSNGPTTMKSQLNCVRIMISTRCSMLINEHILVKIKGCVFRIIILEDLSGSLVVGGDGPSGVKEDSNLDDDDILAT